MATQNNTNQTGAMAYVQVGLETAVANADSHKLIAMLYDGANTALLRARIFMEQDNIAQKGYFLSRAISILEDGLIPSLDFKQGGEIAKNLHALYDYMIRRLLHANVNNDAEAITEVLNLIKGIADAWKQVGPDFKPNQDPLNGTPPSTTTV